MATATTKSKTKKLKLDDELELAFLDSDPRKPRSLSRERREAAKEVERKLKPKDNDFKLLCRIINRHATGLWATAAIVEFLLIWLRIGR